MQVKAALVVAPSLAEVIVPHHVLEYVAKDVLVHV